ncbi:MAG: hypothetical protein ACXVW6_03505 [Nocardioidaceae bacterium]
MRTSPRLGRGLAAAASLALLVPGLPAAASTSTAPCPSSPHLRVATFNVDWALPERAVDHDLDDLKPHADVLLAQEAKNVTVERLLGGGWHTHQDLERRDKRGTAVSWRTGIREPGSGYALGVRPGSEEMLTRWISWTDAEIDGTVVRIASTHRPPPRYDELWPRFDDALSRFVHDSPHPVLVGLDSNTRTHDGLEQDTGLHWHGVGIDCFLTDMQLTDVHALPRGNSDHHPVVGDLAVPCA